MRLIDADSLGVGHCSERILPHAYCIAWNSLVDIINGSPTVDAVEVVRCKDCEHYKQNPWNNETEDLMCMFWCDWLPTEPDDFCSKGERRGVENKYT